jgi:hypothetical protein
MRGSVVVYVIERKEFILRLSTTNTAEASVTVVTQQLLSHALMLFCVFYFFALFILFAPLRILSRLALFTAPASFVEIAYRQNLRTTRAFTLNACDASRSGPYQPQRAAFTLASSGAGLSIVGFGGFDPDLRTTNNTAQDGHGRFSCLHTPVEL